jgi:hypothetical protein
VVWKKKIGRSRIGKEIERQIERYMYLEPVASSYTHTRLCYETQPKDSLDPFPGALSLACLLACLLGLDWALACLPACLLATAYSTAPTNSEHIHTKTDTHSTPTPLSPPRSFLASIPARHAYRHAHYHHHHHHRQLNVEPACQPASDQAHYSTPPSTRRPVLPKAPDQALRRRGSTHIALYLLPRQSW